MDPRPTSDAEADRARDVMLQDVLQGLRLPQKELSPKYFYDVVGSKLFERITELPEYYPTRTERALLAGNATDWVREHRPKTLVELGAGSADKSRILLTAMERGGTGNVYVPVDVSGEFLHHTAQLLRREYDDLQVEPEVADISEPFSLPDDLPRPMWVALLGSTIGNFLPDGAVRLLKRASRHLGSGDRFLLGVDLRPGPGKSVERLELAYNDEAGVTAAFNLNVLDVLNRELGADFDPNDFEHRAFYALDQHRIEMHLVSQVAQEVRIGEEVVVFAKGEAVRTEVSCKHDRASVDALFAAAGLRVERWAEDARGRFALTLAAPTDDDGTV